MDFLKVNSGSGKNLNNKKMLRSYTHTFVFDSLPSMMNEILVRIAIFLMNVHFSHMATTS